MLAAWNRFTDRLLGRGSAAITVPVMDGALKANRALDAAQVVAELPGIDDLASDGRTLWASAADTLYRLEGGTLVAAQRFDAPISALAVDRSQRVAVALAGQSIRVLQAGESHWQELARLERCADAPLRCVNAIAFDADDALVFTEGSQQQSPDAWSRDLMELGHTGRVARWSFAGAAPAQELAGGLRYAYGVAVQDARVHVSESWAHQVVRVEGGALRPVLSELPAYPSRLCAAQGGGLWLSCFASRTQLVEFVLREPAYRERMLREIDPRYWIAPALSSGHSFLEPLQGAGVKQMGVLKPWAPPRSYGLVLRVGADGRVLQSLHSQVDGHHHGITGIAELGGTLYAASKGSGRLLGVPLSQGGQA